MTCLLCFGAHVKSDSDSEKLETSLKRLGVGSSYFGSSYSVGEVQVHPINASFEKQYNSFSVRKALEYLFTYNYKELKNKVSLMCFKIISIFSFLF